MASVVGEALGFVYLLLKVLGDQKDNKVMDIVNSEYSFGMQWSLIQDGMLWVISPESVNQIGCIHTFQDL